MDPSRDALRSPNSGVLPTPGNPYSTRLEDRQLTRGWDTPTHRQVARRTTEGPALTGWGAHTAFDEGGGNGSLQLVQGDTFEEHADGVTRVIRHSLSVANDHLEVMRRQHHGQVQRLKTLLAEEQVRFEQLRARAAVDHELLKSEQRRSTALQRDLGAERDTTARLRAGHAALRRQVAEHRRRSAKRAVVPAAAASGRDGKRLSNEEPKTLNRLILLRSRR